MFKKTFSLNLFVTATRPTSHNKNSKNQEKVLLLRSTLTLWRCAAKTRTKWRSRRHRPNAWRDM